MRVLVSGSSANLGPGFDCLGMAWQLCNEIFFEPAERLEIRGCEEAFCREDNLAWKAFARTMEQAGRPAPPVRIRFGRTEIPVSRGLGSSAALIAAGIAAANALGGLGLSRAEMLRIATETEGHPDNVAPALLGGLTLCAVTEKGVVCEKYAIHRDWTFALVIPDFRLSTKAARRILPASLSYADAIFNISRTALLLRALEEGDAELLRHTMRDRLHEPYRRELIGGFAETETLARRLGAVSLCISGAGPTILCVSREKGFPGALGAALRERFPGWTVREALPCAEEIRVLPE